MDPRIESYINQARASGKTDEQIKQALLQIGWSQTQINEIFGAPVKQPQQRRGSSPLLGIITAIIIIGILAVAGFFVYPIILSQINKLASPSVVVLQDNQTPVATEKTYKSDEFGFQFQYPLNFNLTENPLEAEAEQLLITPNDGSRFDNWEINIAKSDSSYYLLGCAGYEQAEAGVVKNVSDINIGGVIGKKIQSDYQSKNGSYTTEVVCVEKNNIAYAFSATSDGLAKDYDYNLFDKTISSIKFLNQ